MSLLLSEGHANAYYYPIGRLYDESNIVTERNNAKMSLQTVLAQHAHGAVSSRKGGSALQKVLRKLTFTTVPNKPHREDDAESDIWK